MDYPKIRKKEFLDINVYEAAKERIRYCYKNFDKIIVSFSGGKDSTALLHVTLEVARELNKLPLQVIFVDEEAIHPPTIKYVMRVRDMADIQLDWYCLPIKHRNACSNEQPFWYPWNPEEKDLWVRDMPPFALVGHPSFTFGMSIPEWMPRIYGPKYGKVCYLTGIRTQESLRRYTVIAKKKNDSFLTLHAEHKNAYKAHPIYDWSSEDVWKLVQLQGLDYNRTYDIFNKTDLSERFLHQRVCPPFGEEPLRNLWLYSECFPEMWHKMLYRVKGVATAWRYANTELYSNWEKPEGKTWREYFEVILAGYDLEYQEMIRKKIASLHKNHAAKTDEPIEDEEAHPLSGACWKFFCKIAQKGDFKGRQAANMIAQGTKVLKKRGMSLEEARQKHGKKAQ